MNAPMTLIPPHTFELREPKGFFTRSFLALHPAGAPEPAYTVRTPTLGSLSSRHGADLILHPGAAKDGPIAGLARLRSFHADLLGRGDPDAPGGATWEELRRVSAWEGRYGLALDLPSAGGAGGVTRREFLWTRTTGSAAWFGKTGVEYRLVDRTPTIGGGETLVATMHARGTWGTCLGGAVCFVVPVPTELHLWVLLSATTLVYKTMLTFASASTGAGSA